jgi:hypothetical protein
MHVREGDGRPFYIGKGKGSRAWSSKNRNRMWKNVAAKHGYAVKILANWPDEASAFEHEKVLIAAMKDMGIALCNLTCGGEGASGVSRSLDFRRRVSEVHKGKVATKETRRRISESSRGRRLNLDARFKISQALRGRQVSLSTREKIGAKHRGKVRTEEDKLKQSQTNRARAPKIVAHGQSLSRREWAEHLGVNMATVTRRLQRGLAPDGRQLT